MYYNIILNMCATWENPSHGKCLTFSISSENWRLSYAIWNRKMDKLTFNDFILTAAKEHHEHFDSRYLTTNWLTELNSVWIWHLTINNLIKMLHSLCEEIAICYSKILDILRQADCFYHHVLKFAHYPTCNKQDDSISKIENTIKNNST